MISGELPDGTLFLVRDEEVANRLRQGGPESQKAFEQRADSVYEAFAWLHASGLSGNDWHDVVKEIYLYAHKHGLIADDLDAILEEATGSDKGTY